MSKLRWSILFAMCLALGCQKESGTATVKSENDEPEEEHELAAAAHHAPVQFLSACECKDNHGVWRWTAKTETTPPPAVIAVSNKVRPSKIAAWPGPGGHFDKDTPRSGREDEWYEVTGRVEKIKAED